MDDKTLESYELYSHSESEHKRFVVSHPYPNQGGEKE